MCVLLEGNSAICGDKDAMVNCDVIELDKSAGGPIMGISEFRVSN